MAKGRKPMRIFVSAGEPSGDLHGSNFIRALHQLDQNVECVGFGGDRMTQAGCQLLYPLCQLAITGFVPVLLQIRTFFRLLAQADECFKTNRPDAVVLIDYPGFHWWVAHRAHQHGIPVFYFVPPQLWAWAGWRVKKMRRSVDHVLCSLPFEKEWYRQRDVSAHYVGHPYFDELPTQQLDANFQQEQQKRGGTIIGLLPGSRNQELTANLPTLLGAAQKIHAARPEIRFLVACFKQQHLERVESALRAESMPYVEPFVGRTPDIISAAHSCIAVSGSVGLELLYRAKPSIIVYRAPAFLLFLSRYMKKCRYMSLVNLLVDEELYPEFLSARCEAEGVGRRMLEWLDNPASLELLRTRLEKLAAETARPGACEHAARFVLEHVHNPTEAKKSYAA
jgi:lipid-A-disaccharide synthase